VVLETALLELASFLRKANRALRLSSLAALDVRPCLNKSISLFE
jgi:hypothetical protein